MATDKRLDQVSTLTDFDYALIVKGDQVAKVTASQLASVVAGLMGNPSGTIRQRLDSSINLDSVTESGYYTTDGSANQPSNYVNYWGVLRVCKYADKSVEQLWQTNNVYTEIYHRKFEANSQTWTPWQRIDNFGYNSLADFAGGVAEHLPYVSNRYTNESDFNNLKKAGSYPFGASKEGYSNIPNVQSLEGVLVVINGVTNSNIIQMYLGVQDNSMHIRSCYNGVWQGWRKVSA